MANPWEKDWSKKPAPETEPVEPAAPVVQDVPADEEPSGFEGVFKDYRSITDNPVVNYFSNKGKRNFEERANISNNMMFNNIRKQMGIYGNKDIVDIANSQTEAGMRKKRYDEAMNTVARNVDNPVMTAAGGEVTRIGQYLKKGATYPFTSQEYTDKIQHDIDHGGEMLARLRNEKPAESFVGSVLPYFAIPELRLAKGAKKIPGFNKMRMNETSNVAMFNILKRNAEAAKMRKYADAPIKSKGSLAYGTEKVLKGGANVRADLIDAGTRLGIKLPETIANSRTLDNTLLAGTMGAIHPDDTLVGGSFAGGLGYQVGKGFGHMFGKPQYDLTDNAIQNNTWMKRNNMFTPISLKTKTKFNEMMDQGFEGNTHTADIMNDKFARNKKIINNIAARTIGDPDVLGAPAYARKGDQIVKDMSEGYVDSQFQRIKGDLDIAEDRMSALFTRNDLEKVNRITKAYTDNVDKKLHPTLKAQAQKVTNAIIDAMKVDGYTKPGQFSRLTKKLRDLSIARRKTDPDLADDLDKLQDVLHAAGKKGSAPGDLALHKKAKQQYSRMLLIEKSLDAEGNIDPNKLYNQMNNKFWKSALKTGSADPDVQDLVEIARYGKRLKDRRGASLGTSQEISNAIANPMQAAFKGSTWLANRADIGMGPRMLLSLYNAGYPHTTGYIPGLSKEFVARLGSRATMGKGSDKEDDQYK